MSYKQVASIGIDIGTSGCRAIAINESKQIISSHQYDYADNDCQTNTLISEQDPQQLWRDTRYCLDKVMRDCSKYEIQAIAVDATSGSILFTDNEGQPLTPILLYNDVKSREQAQYIAKVAPNNCAAHGTGSGLAKACYLLAHYPIPHTAQLLHQADWINFMLGAPIGQTDEHNALKTGYDPINQVWPSWLSEIIPSHYLPNVVLSGSSIGFLSKRLCQRYELTTQPTIMAGTTDSVAGFIATGARETGDAVTSLGSTLVCKIISNNPVFESQFGIYSHRLGDKWIVGGASNTGCAVLRHFFTNEQLDLLSTQIELSQTVPYYYPLLTKGERFPVNDPELAPILTPRPEKDCEFLHGLLQGIANIEQQAYTCLTNVGTPAVQSVRTVGGGAKNRVWQQIRQHTLTIPLLSADHTEAAYGSALIAHGELQNN